MTANNAVVATGYRRLTAVVRPAKIDHGSRTMRLLYCRLFVCLLSLVAGTSWAADSDRYLTESFPRTSIASNIVYGEATAVIGGGSAGAFTALSIAYGSGKKAMGDIHIRAVIDIWGGLLRTGTMEQGDPPLIIIHGTDDKTVPFHFAERLNARAKEAGIPCEFHPLPGAGHAAWDNMDEYIAWIAPFLYRHVIDGRNP